MTRVFIALTILAFLLPGCAPEPNLTNQRLYNGLVDDRLIPYFESFVYEASVRGVVVDFDLYPVSGQVVEIPEANIAGTCNYNSNKPNLVTIDLSYWNASPNLRREMVVFHELGHCYLGREHLETAFDNGICASIMNSGTSGCTIAYNQANRDYYLDELFSY